MSIPATGLSSPLLGPIQLDKRLGGGREGVTYTLVGNTNLVAKIYHTVASPATTRKLEIMISNPPALPPAPHSRPTLAWPRALVYDDQGMVRGFLMPIVDPTWSLDSLFFPERRGRLTTSNNVPIGWHHLHEIARNLTLIVATCHNAGYVIGDLNNQNVRVYSDGHVTLIDTDSFQVIDRNQTPPVVHHCEVTFPDYTPPELLNKDLSNFERYQASDLYVLAVLIFKLLQDGLHPFAAATETNPPLDPSQVMQRGWFPYVPNTKSKTATPYPNVAPFARLHPRLKVLFVKAFTEGLANPQQRPSALSWERALVGARKDLRKCARGHYFSASEDVPCLQLVTTKVGIGYCGSTETTKSSGPLPFGSVDPITGPKANIHSSGPSKTASVQPAPPAPPPVSPQGTPTVLNQNKPGKRIRNPFILLIVGFALAAVIWYSTRTDTQPLPSLPTHVVRSQPTTVPTERPKDIATTKSVNTQSVNTNEVAPASSNDTDPTRSTDLVAQPALFQQSLEAFQNIDAFIYSSSIGGKWSLNLISPNDSRGTLTLTESSIDPAPALSFDGARLAYLSNDSNNYTIIVLDFSDMSTFVLPFASDTFVPDNLMWVPDGSSLLLTVYADHEPHIMEIDVSSKEMTQFLPAWSANPATSNGDHMAYVVPQSVNGSSNLGIVLADAEGAASIYLASSPQDENYPSLNREATYLGYDLDTGEGHSLIIKPLRSDTSARQQLPFISRTPIRSSWTSSDSIVFAACGPGECQLVMADANGNTQSITVVPHVDSVGTVIFRIPS